ncbi:CPBP family intramembrane glutamic endopeptidase, partial [Salmonella enterica]
MIQSRNKYLQFMLVLLAAWAIAWGAMFVMGQAVRLCRIKKSSDNMLFFF